MGPVHATELHTCEREPTVGKYPNYCYACSCLQNNCYKKTNNPKAPFIWLGPKQTVYWSAGDARWYCVDCAKQKGLTW